MRISIAQKLSPFSHQPGTRCLIPGTSCEVQIFPTLVRIDSSSVALDLKGPVAGFTVQQDLQKNVVRVFGNTQDGFVRYLLLRQEDAIILLVEKAPSGGLRTGKGVLKEKQRCAIAPTRGSSFPSRERLSLGMHRSQDWELVRRRHDLKEIFPVWFCLGATLPQEDLPASSLGTLSLLQSCADLIAARQREEIVPAFLRLFDAGFQGILSPTLIDENHLGILPALEKISGSASPLALLTKGAALIRSLFIQEIDTKIALLPCLPPEFVSGRFTDFKTRCGDLISFEWSKKLLSKVILHPAQDRAIHLLLQPSLKSFRLRRTFREKGEIQTHSAPLLLKAGETLYLDRFLK